MGGTASSTPDAQTSGVSNSARRDGSFMATAASVPRQETVQSCNNDSLRSSQRGVEFTALDEEGNYCVENESQRRRSTHTPSQMQQVNPNERLRPSTLRRQSFLVEFSKTKGPPQIAFLMMLVAIGAGSTIGVSIIESFVGVIRMMPLGNTWKETCSLKELLRFLSNLRSHCVFFAAGRPCCHDRPLRKNASWI
jgi:hypothetical protein